MLSFQQLSRAKVANSQSALKKGSGKSSRYHHVAPERSACQDGSVKKLIGSLNYRRRSGIEEKSRDAKGATLTG